MRRTSIMAVAAALALIAGCKETVVPDLNAPSESDFSVINTRGQLQALATGLANGDRAPQGFQILVFETMARDLYRIDPAEARYITGLLGNAPISNSNFIGNGIWTGSYRYIRSADLTIGAVEASKTATPAPLSEAEKSAVKGYANTLKASIYIHLIETRDTLGIPIMVNPNAPVPFRCKPTVLAYISALLDTAQTQLLAGGTTFPFLLPTGFNGFNTPATFNQYNRTMKVKVEMYRAFVPLEMGGPTVAPVASNLADALTALGGTFYQASSQRSILDIGVYHTYSTASGEIANPLFDGSVFRVNPKVISEGAEPGDLRVQVKVDTSPLNRTLSGSSVSSRYMLRTPSSPTAPIAAVRDEELILDRALIVWGQGNDAAANGLVNLIRASAGLAPAPVVDHQATLRQILKERRYSLLFEGSGSRLIDYRMFGIMSELGLERSRKAIPVFPIPLNESVARSGQVGCVN